MLASLRVAYCGSRLFPACPTLPAVVPLHYTWSAAQLTSVLQNLNGAFFTGGGASLDNGSAYFQCALPLFLPSLTSCESMAFADLW